MRFAGTDAFVQHWNVSEISEPDGSRSPHVLHSQAGQARVVAIHLRAGQELGDHQVKETALLVVVDGAVRIEAGDESLDGNAGTVVRFEPDERHAVVASLSASSPDAA